MRIDVLTLFPECFNILSHGIIGKALEKGLFQVNLYNIRDYSLNKHHKCDDYPYGGGAGMVMTPQPVCDAIEAVDGEHKALRVFMSPRGKKLNQEIVKELSTYDRILILSGNYEGVDQRVIDLTIDLELSIGDYVLTGGELPALVLINAISRYIPGVLGSSDSVMSESFSDNLLEYPQYTRPQDFRGLVVPEVLCNGNHKEIEEWRKAKQLKLTKEIRPDLMESD